MLYVVRRFLWMSLLLTLADSTNTLCLHFLIVIDTIARQFPQDIQAFSIDVSHALVPHISRLDLQNKTVGVVAKFHTAANTVPEVHIDGTQLFASRFVSSQLLHR